MSLADDDDLIAQLEADFEAVEADVAAQFEQVPLVHKWTPEMWMILLMARAESERLTQSLIEEKTLLLLAREDRTDTGRLELAKLDAQIDAERERTRTFREAIADYGLFLVAYRGDERGPIDNVIFEPHPLVFRLQERVRGELAVDRMVTEYLDSDPLLRRERSNDWYLHNFSVARRGIAIVSVSQALAFGLSDSAERANMIPVLEEVGFPPRRFEFEEVARGLTPGWFDHAVTVRMELEPSALVLDSP